MAQDIVSYAKSLWNKITKSKQSKQAEADAMKELEAFLAQQSDGSGLPSKPVLPDGPQYERMEAPQTSDEEIEKQAESSLGEYKNQSLGAIDEELEALRTGYENRKGTAEKSLAEKNDAVTSAYGTAKKSTGDDLLKRGLARSSIAANKQAELENAAAKQKSDAYAVYKDEIDRLDGEIGGLEAKRVKALDDFNVSYAAKLTEKISGLKKDRDDRAAEALKYNNSLTEKEYGQSVDKTMKESDLYGEALDRREKENGITGENGGEARYRDAYNQMAKTLRGMNPIDAREALSDNKLFRANLNDYYFYLLYDEFGR